MLPKMKFPAGYRWELAGDYRTQQESFASLLMVSSWPRPWCSCSWASSSAA